MVIRKKLIAIGLAALSLKLLIAFNAFWTRYPGGIWNLVIYLTIAFLFFWLVIRSIKEIIDLIKNRSSLRLNAFLPIMLIFLALFTILSSPDIPEETIYGKVVFRACYEGTQNQTTFKLREANRFEIHSTGVFFYDKFLVGNYTQDGDTLNLNYDDEVSERFGHKIFMDNQAEILVPIVVQADTTRRPFTLYYGYCSGVN